VGRADEAAAVAGVYVIRYDGVHGNDALQVNDDENGEAVALAAVAATEKLQ